MSTAPPPLAADLTAGLRRLKLAAMRRLAPELTGGSASTVVSGRPGSPIKGGISEIGGRDGYCQ